MASRAERNDKIKKDRKKQIINASVKVFSKKGFHASTTTEIARTAGISEGTIYRYFKSKDELLKCIFDEIVPIYHPSLNLSTEANSSFIRIIKKQLIFNIENENILFLLTSEAQQNPKFGKYFAKEILDPFHRVLKSNLENAIDKGEIQVKNTELAVRIIHSFLIGAAILYRLEGKEGYINKKSLDELADGVLKAIKN